MSKIGVQAGNLFVNQEIEEIEYIQLWSEEEMSKEAANPSQETNIAPPQYCMQLGSNYCKNQCPKGCYDIYQARIDKLFETLHKAETPKEID